MASEIFVGRNLPAEGLSKVQEGVQVVLAACKESKTGSPNLLALLDLVNYYEAESDLLDAESQANDSANESVALTGLVIARLNRDAILREIDFRRTVMSGYNTSYEKVLAGVRKIDAGYYDREGCRTSFEFTAQTLDSILTAVRGFPRVAPETYFSVLNA